MIKSIKHKIVRNRAKPMTVIEKRPTKNRDDLEEGIAKKERLSIECSAEEKKLIKMIATYQDTNITEFVMACVRKEFKSFKSKKNNVPNTLTAKVLNETEEGKNLIKSENFEEFWNSLGLDDV